MTMIDPLAIAAGGLANVNRAIGIVSHNIANANTPGYLREIHTQTAITAGGLPMGVATGLTTRDLDAALQARLFTQNAATSASSARAEALNQIDVVHGKPGSASDLAALLGKLRDGFSTLASDPASGPQQHAVVDQAGTFATQIRSLAAVVGAGRQNAHDQLAAGINTLNGTLGRIGDFNRQIIQLRVGGGDTADLENARDAAVQEASSTIDLKTLLRPNGEMSVFSTSGIELPTLPGAPKLTVAATAVGTTSYYPGGGVPGVMLGGVDVTGQLTSGTIGAAVMLRDTTLPIFQGELDEFAETTSTRFAAQGLALFTDPAGTVPVSAGVPRQAPYIGYANVIQVNPAVQADPSLVRDGTRVVVAIAGGPLAFTPNPPGGPAGFGDLITRVLTCSLGDQLASGIPQPAPDLTGMGPAGTLRSGTTAPPKLTSFAATIVAQQTGEAATAQRAATAAGDIQAALQQSMSQRSGVNMDTELSIMIALQNAYAANAKLISTSQAMWSQLLQAIQ